jgi:hypothetical protein
VTRDDQIKAVDQGFKDLAEFAAGTWSNLAIVDRLNALHLMVRELYPPVLVPGPPLPPPVIPRQKPLPRVDLPEGFEPVEVTDSTRWG